MSGRKVTIVLEDEDYSLLEKQTKTGGFGRVSTLIRHLAVTRLREPEGGKTITLTVENYDEVLAYVHEKKLGNIAVFAAYAMEQYMQRVPLTQEQRKRADRNIK